jgi:hypothetical protein
MARMNIPIFPLDGIPEPWAEVFNGLTNDSVLVCLAAGTFEGERSWAILQRIFILHWVAKLRFTTHHQISLSNPPKHRETYKPIGELYYSVLRLCEATTDSESDASVLFLKVALEAFVESPGIPLSQKSRKSKGIATIKQQNDALEGGCNPFDRHKSPATHQLIEAAQKKVREDDQFSSLWEDFLAKRKKLRQVIGDRLSRRAKSQSP